MILIPQGNEYRCPECHSHISAKPPAACPECGTPLEKPGLQSYRESSHERLCQIVEEQERRLAEMQAEIERLQEKLDQLPTTADGVPIVPGQDVWTWSPGKPQPETVTLQRIGACGLYAGCYSTREAALKARTT